MADYSSNSTNDQVNNTIPGSTSKNIKKRSTFDLLPEYLQSDTNKKFLNATLDQMIVSGNPKIESGYIGKKVGAIRSSANDVYSESKTTLNNRYQVDPTVVSQNPSTLEYESAIPYDDIISKLKYLEANTTNLDKLFSDTNYSWRPPIDVDKFINWNSYVWLPFGLPLVGLHGEDASTINGKRTYTTSAQVIHGNRQLTLENGMRLAFSDDNKTYLVTGVGKEITLIDESTLCSVTEHSMGIAPGTLALGTPDTGTGVLSSLNITNYGTGYTYNPFWNIYDSSGGPATHAIVEGELDGDATANVSITEAGTGYATSGVVLLVMGGQKAMPPYISANKDVHYVHEYICMEKCARDNNAWSRVNNWHHINTIQAVNTMLNLTKSFKIDGIIVDDDYAQRPIIEWERDLHLYNYGTHFRAPVNIIIEEVFNPADITNGFLLSGGSAAPEVHDGYIVQLDDRVLFTGTTNSIYKNKIFKVNTGNTGATALTLETDGRGSGTPTHGDVITSLNGDILQGQDYWFDGKTQTWKLTQEKGTKNVPVKFELYDTTFKPLSEYFETDFLGNTIFEYLEDKTTADRSADKFLGFALTYATTNYLSSTNTSNIMFNNSHQETMYLYDRGTIPKNILGLYYLRKFNRDESDYNFNNCWEQSYKQIRTPITVTQDITNAEDDFVVNLGTTNFEPERDYNVIATATGFEFYLKSAYGFEKLTEINPILYVAKGQTYTFEITNGTTAFQIQDASASAYNTGVTNNNTNSGIVTFAPAETETNDILYYSSPSGTGKIIIIDKVLEQGWPEVYHNGVRLTRDIHYIFNDKNVVIPYESPGTDETVSDGGVPVFAPFEQTQSTENLLAVGDVVDVKFYTTDTSTADEWAYDVPNNLKNNPGNEVLGQVQYAEIFPHFVDVLDKQPGLIGPAFGNNNYRSLGIEKRLGGTINQQISPLLKSGLILGNENYDLLLAFDYTADSYNVFKKKFVQKVEQLYASMASGTKISALVDQALYDLNLGKNNTFPFANSDMAYYFNMVEKTYTVTTSADTFTLPKTITQTNQYHNHVYVYTVDTNEVETFITSFTLDPNANTIKLGTAVASGKVVIKVSIDEGLSFIPPTLAKLGVVSAYVPKSYVDDTGTRTVVVIEGHDGSKTVAFESSITGTGSILSHTITDYRDKALLELENRIYGHIQSEFNANDDNVVTYSHSSEPNRKDLTLFPGKYRTTPYTIKNRNDFYDNYFNAFKLARGITLLENTGYDTNNKFTWNYGADANADGIGYWRGIYKHYFDTDRPHTHPWEMLGFTGKPSWWDTHYEWVNATKRNNMISALQKGIISEPGQTLVQDINVARSGATFPVAADGTLQDPVTATLMSAPATIDAKENWTIGDNSPIETIWQRSSLFPYVENQFLFSINPATFFEKHYDTKDRITDSGREAITLTVTTAPAAGNISGAVYYINGIQQQKLVLQAGKVYTFNLTDVSNSGHLFRLSETTDGTNGGGIQYTTGWDEATDATKPTFSPTSSTPEVLYYYCATGGFGHILMGGTVETLPVSHLKQIISNKTKKRHNSNELYIHNEVDVSGLSRRVLGLQQPIVDRLMYLGNNIYTNFARHLRQLNTKLSYKMQGFTKKSSISMLADSLQSEKSNNFIPNDDLTIDFHTSAPYQEINYSGVEIIKTDNGYAVYGYNNNKPYFLTQKTLKTTISQIKVSETNIQLYTEFAEGAERIDYGTEFLSANDVYNFLHAYGKYLENIGFEFTHPNIDGAYEDWTLIAQQFILWSEAEWGDDTSIKLSPAGNLLYFKHEHGHIKSNEYEYGSFYLDVNKSLFDSTTVDVDRQLNYVTIKPKDENRAIYCASLVICDYEHLLLINNKTIFDDIIYYPILGDAKLRFKIEYLKASDWNGTLHAPGYFVYGDTIYENLDKTADSIASNYFASEQTVLNKDVINVARKNIGYEKKQFLRNMRLSEDVQFQFMKGVSHLKGTPEVFNRLTRSTFLLEASVDINLQEEWMFRLGEFGPSPPQTTKEFTLKDTDIKANPQLINFGEIYPGQATDFDYDTTISMLGGDGRWLEQPSTNPAVQFTTRIQFDQSIDTIAEVELYEKDLPNAGYPRIEETTYQTFKSDDLPALYDKYKDDDSSLLYKLLQTPNWKDTYTYAKDYYVRYKGKRYLSTRIINAAAKSFYGIVNAKYTKTYSGSGNLAEIVIEKCVFTVDGITKVTATSDPYLYGITGVTARFGEYDFTYYTPTGWLSDSTVDVSVSKGGDANGDFTYILTFADGEIPAVNVPADDDKVYMSAFNYKTDAEAADNTVLDRWIETGEAGLFNVWTADAGAGDWSTFNLQDDNFGIEQICKGYETGDEALIKLGMPHYLSEGDYVMITGAENNPALNGIHKVTGFPTGSDCQTCGLREDKQFYIDEFVGNNEVYGKVFAFRKSRFSGISSLFASISDLKYSWVTNNYAYADEYNDTQDQVIGASAAAGSLNPEFSGGTSFTLTSTYQLLYPATTDDLDVFIGEFRTRFEPGSGASKAWEVIGTSIVFYPENLAGSFQAGQPLMIVFRNRSAGWGSFKYDGANRNWIEMNRQQPKADTGQLANVIVYDYEQNKELARAEVWDPFKGIIPGIAEKEIDIVSGYDQALYNATTQDEETLTTTRHWGQHEVGTSWWNLNTVRYIEYEQPSDLDYTFKHWGDQFPGSSMDVYEWTKSTVAPDEWITLVNGNYEIDGEIASGEAYTKVLSGVTHYYWVEEEAMNPQSGQVIPYYYFWVKNKTSVPPTQSHRELSTKVVAEYLNDPTGNGLFWAAPGGASNIITGNIGEQLTQNSVFQINFTSDIADEHKEWITIREEDQETDVPPRFANRLHESLLGIDENKDTLTVAGIEEDQNYTYTASNGSTTSYTSKKFNYDWNQALEYKKRNVVKNNTKLYKIHKDLSLVKTNTKLSVDNQVNTIQLRIGEKANELTFPAHIEIGTPPAESNTYGLPYENILAYAYANIVNGRVDSITVNRGGQGYNSATKPTVTIGDPILEGGVRATVEDSDITIVNGEITAIAIQSANKGSGYEQSYAIIDEGEVEEEIVELKYFDRFATRLFSSDVNILSNSDFEQKTTAFWDTKLGTLDTTGKVATVAIYAGGTGYTSGISATTGGSGTGLILDITQISGVIQSATVTTGGGGYTVGDVISVTSTGSGADGTFTIATINSDGIIYGNASGVYTGDSVNATHYVGQKGLKNASLSGGTVLENVQYLAKALFKTNVSLDYVKLKYGHSATDVDFDAMTAVTLTPQTSSEESTLGTTLVYSVQGEFVSSTDDYHALWLEVTPTDSNGFILHIDSLEFTNPAIGDRIVVGRGAQSTTASAHLQYATFKELGNFARQRWQELLTYEWIDDRNIYVDTPNMVPNLRLHEIFRYGGQVRPYKQSWIKSRIKAIRALIQNANKNLLKMNLSDSYLNWKKHLGTAFVKGNSTFSPQDYWKYVDWFHPDYTISSSSVAQYTVTERNNLYDVDEDVYSIVRVDSDDADGNWAFYQWIDDSWFKIGKQNGTIELSKLLYDVQDVDAGWDAAEFDIGGWDKNYTNELQAILKGLHEDIFVGPYKQYYKELFFTIIHFIYAEQTNLDWVAKTTFLQLQRRTPGALTPKTFDVGSEEDILDYLNEVKPYHSKIETIFDARTFDEEINASADEVVDIRVQTNTSGSTEDNDSRAWRMFIDNTGTRIYETMLDANKSTTAEVLDSIETEITVVASGGFPASGEVVIGAERIKYASTSSNILHSCIRGVAGTSAATHASGVEVVVAGPAVGIPVDPDPEAYNAFNDDGTTTIQNSTNSQATLINAGKGTI